MLLEWGLFPEHTFSIFLCSHISFSANPDILGRQACAASLTSRSRIYKFRAGQKSYLLCSLRSWLQHQSLQSLIPQPLPHLISPILHERWWGHYYHSFGNRRALQHQTVKDIGRNLSPPTAIISNVSLSCILMTTFADQSKVAVWHLPYSYTIRPLYHYCKCLALSLPEVLASEGSTEGWWPGESSCTRARVSILPAWGNPTPCTSRQGHPSFDKAMGSCESFDMARWKHLSPA